MSKCEEPTPTAKMALLSNNAFASIEHLLKDPTMEIELSVKTVQGSAVTRESFNRLMRLFQNCSHWKSKTLERTRLDVDFARGIRITWDVCAVCNQPMGGILKCCSDAPLDPPKPIGIKKERLYTADFKSERCWVRLCARRETPVKCPSVCSPSNGIHFRQKTVRSFLHDGVLYDLSTVRSAGTLLGLASATESFEVELELEQPCVLSSSDACLLLDLKIAQLVTLLLDE